MISVWLVLFSLLHGPLVAGLAAHGNISVSERHLSRRQSYDQNLTLSIDAQGMANEIGFIGRRRARRRRSTEIKIGKLAKLYCESCRDYAGNIWPDHLRLCSMYVLGDETDEKIDIRDELATDPSCYRPTGSNIPPELTNDQQEWAETSDAEKVCSCMDRWIHECDQEQLDGDYSTDSHATPCVYEKICGCSACDDFKKAWGCMDMASSDDSSSWRRRRSTLAQVASSSERDASWKENLSSASLDNTLEGKCA